jgi:DNA-binding transcriptional regulator YdaS (Cro superfamily)
MTFQDALKKHLIQTGMTQTQFAARIDRSQGYVSRLLKGEETPSWKLAIDIERATAGQVSKHLARPDVFGTREHHHG